MRTLLLGLPAVSVVVLGLVACSGGPGDVPTQRSVSLSSGGTGDVEDGTDKPTTNTGGTSKNGGTSTTTPSCQLGSSCSCEGGQQGVVTQCSNDTPTCTCTGFAAGDAG
jgi:hypothetical protein